MGGDDQTRFCMHCQKRVHNLSAMNSGDANRLLCQSAGDLCVRYQLAGNDQIVTLDYQQRPPRKKWLWPITAVTAIAALVTSALNQSRPVPRIVMGAMPPKTIIASPAGGRSNGASPSQPATLPASPVK
jgi:hypothetical protein